MANHLPNTATLLVILAATTSLPIFGASDEDSIHLHIIANDNQPATRVCLSAATDSPNQFTRMLRRVSLSYLIAARSIRCNDQPLNQFAARYNPHDETIRRLNRYSRPDERQ